MNRLTQHRLERLGKTYGNYRARPVLLAAAMLFGVLHSAVMADESAGPALYQTFCAVCHGSAGEGDPLWPKPNDLGDMPAPPHNTSGHTWRHSDADLLNMTLNGHRDPYNSTDYQTMPAFRGILTETQIEAIFEHLKTLWTDKQLAAQAGLNRAE
jgi:mono/diheme cytochrome c family protein